MLTNNEVGSERGDGQSLCDLLGSFWCFLVCIATSRSPGIRFNKGICELGMGAGRKKGKGEGGGGAPTNGTGGKRIVMMSVETTMTDDAATAVADSDRSSG